jgi:hypothetical protein
MLCMVVSSYEYEQKMTAITVVVSTLELLWQCPPLPKTKSQCISRQQHCLMHNVILSTLVSLYRCVLPQLLKLLQLSIFDKVCFLFFFYFVRLGSLACSH